MRRIRCCSFCGQSGHNKTTCASRKSAKKAYYADRAETRAKILERMKRNGFGVGCIFKFDDATFFVKEINWENIACYGYYNSVVAEVINGHSLYGWCLDLPKFCYDPDTYLGDKMEVINPINPDTIENTIPDGWHDGTLGNLPGYLS